MSEQTKVQIFITGGSGFLGTAILPLLVRHRDVEKVHVLIRDSSKLKASERLKALVSKLFVPSERAEAAAKLTAVPGDLTLAGMGLSRDAYDQLAAASTHILHVGASTDFSSPLAESRRINVDGTQLVLDFARRTKELNPSFKRFDYVSTAYVAGTKPGLVDEETTTRGQNFANPYEQSKYEAELLVRDWANEIPTVIHRPSIVVGDSRNGFTPHFKVLYWPLLLLSKNILPFIPCNPKATLDIVPVNFVAESIVALMMCNAVIGQTFYQVAGPQSNLLIKDFLRDAFAMTSIKRRPLMPLWVFKYLRSETLKPLMSEHFWQACDLAAVYSEYIRGTEVRFDNRKTTQQLKTLGIEPAPRWHEFKEQVFRYCMETKWGKRPTREEFKYRNPDLALDY